eukprot:5366189-Amphidinium_carterae.2
MQGKALKGGSYGSQHLWPSCLTNGSQERLSRLCGAFLRKTVKYLLMYTIMFSVSALHHLPSVSSGSGFSHVALLHLELCGQT